MADSTSRIVAARKWDYEGSKTYDDWFEVLNIKRSGTNSSKSAGKAPVDISIDVPTSQLGVPVPYIIGRHVVSSPCVMSYGNLTPIYKTDTVVTQSKELVTVIEPGGWPNTYEEVHSQTVSTTYISGYSMDIQLGICLGPEVKLVGIYYNNEKIWEGSLGPARATMTLPAGLGAISGATLIFHGGAFDQTRDPVYTDTDIPGYVGISYAIIQGIRADQPLSSIFFEVERFPNPLGLTSGQNRKNNDINIFTAIADLLTNSWGGAGLDISNIDTATFSSAAVTTAGESNYCAISESGTPSVISEVGVLLGQAQALMYQNPGTGKVEVALVRKNFSLQADSNLGISDISKLRNFKKTSPTALLQKLVGSFTRRDQNYAPDSVFSQVADVTDPSKIGSRNYAFTMNQDLIQSLLARDLSQASAPLFSMSLEISRKGDDYLPGRVLTVAYPNYYLYGLPVYVTGVRDMDVNDNTIIVELGQLVTPDITPVFDTGDKYDPGVKFDPKAPTGIRIVTAPYWMARTVGQVNSSTSTNSVGGVVLPIPADDLQSDFAVYSVYSGDPATVQKYVDKGNYPTYGKLSASISKYDGWLTGMIDELTLTNVINPINLKTIGEDGVAQGQLFMFIDDEILSFEDIAETGLDQYTLYNVHRALLDTVAGDHAAAADAYVINNNYKDMFKMLTKFSGAFSYSFTVVSSTSQVVGDFGVATQWKTFNNSWADTVSRTLSPLRPSDTKLNGTRNQTSVDVILGDDITVSWKNRARTSGTVVDQTDATQTGEAASNSTYQYVDIMLGGVSIWQSSNTAATPTSHTVTTPTSGIPLGNQTLYVRTSLDFSFGTLRSVFKDELLVQVLPQEMFVDEAAASYFVNEANTSIFVQE